jgi:hypothetical protein
MSKLGRPLNDRELFHGRAIGYFVQERQACLKKGRAFALLLFAILFIQGNEGNGMQDTAGTMQRCVLSWRIWNSAILIILPGNAFQAQSRDIVKLRCVL